MSKSHVSIEQHVCIVTGKPYDTGGLLLDKQLKNSLERKTVTNYGISPEVQEKIDKGYVPLVVIDPEKSDIGSEGNIDPKTAYRTGEIAYVKESFLLQVYDVEEIKTPFIFTDEETVKKLRNIYENALKNNEEEE